MTLSLPHVVLVIAYWVTAVFAALSCCIGVHSSITRRDPAARAIGLTIDAIVFPAWVLVLLLAWRAL